MGFCSKCSPTLASGLLRYWNRDLNVVYGWEMANPLGKLLYLEA